LFVSVKVTGFLVRLKAVGLEAKSHGVSPTISGRAGSRVDPGGGCRVAASWYVAPRNLCCFGL
jgi:hypothetical protein